MAKLKEMRLHDRFYLKENRYNNTKESFLFLINKLKKNINLKQNYRVLDIGCANGELIYNLEKNFKNLEITGYDIRQDLLDKAKKNVSSKVKFAKKDILKLKNSNKKFDIVILCGVISIFDNYKQVLSNIDKLIDKNGDIYIMSFFNPYDYDVYVKYVDVKKNKNIMQSGWNIISLASIKSYYKKKDVQIFEFNMKKKVKKNLMDDVRSWTINIKNKKYFTNGLSILQYQYWIKISSK